MAEGDWGLTWHSFILCFYFADWLQRCLTCAAACATTGHCILSSMRRIKSGLNSVSFVSTEVACKHNTVVSMQRE